jgi:hypothetical protein
MKCRKIGAARSISDTSGSTSVGNARTFVPLRASSNCSRICCRTLSSSCNLRPASIAPRRTDSTYLGSQTVSVAERRCAVIADIVIEELLTCFRTGTNQEEKDDFQVISQLQVKIGSTWILGENCRKLLRVRESSFDRLLADANRGGLLRPFYPRVK